MHGVVKEGATRFELNLLAGGHSIEGTGANVALHVNVRFDEGKIVLNALEGGEWRKEHRVKNPYHPGDTFDIRVRVHEDRYELLVNQKEVAEFAHVIPLPAVDHIEIRGDIRLDSARWGGRYFQLPYEAAFHDGHLKAGEVVLINGIPTGDRFEIDFIGRDESILFHYNVRLNEKKVIRNSFINGVWGTEEREGVFPFKKDTAFDLVIQNQPYSVQIFVNGNRIGTFAHRTSNPRHDYHKIRVSGTVDLTGLEVTYPHHEAHPY